MFSLWLFDMTLNIYSMIGMVLLVGLVAKNSILLVEFANQRLWGTLGAGLMIADATRRQPRAGAALQQAIAALIQNRTTIVIAHRLSTIQAADRIVALRAAYARVDEWIKPAAGKARRRNPLSARAPAVTG